MCQNIFKNQEEEKRKNDFTKLFAVLVSRNMISKQKDNQQMKREACQNVGG